jgi:hypothetical protein
LFGGVESLHIRDARFQPGDGGDAVRVAATSSGAPPSRQVGYAPGVVSATSYPVASLSRLIGRAEAARLRAGQVVAQAERASRRRRQVMVNCLEARDRMANLNWRSTGRRRVSRALGASLDRSHARYGAAVGRSAEIGRAMAAISSRRGCPPDEAFQILRELSQRRNQRLAELAAEIVRMAPPPPGEGVR